MDAAEETAHWNQISTPTGVEWSGRSRYAAAMYFYRHGQMDAETLEIYRICSRLDAEDPVTVMRRWHVGADWIERLQMASDN
nr:hypothetical protein [uncultured Gellertiella sp.]